MKTPILIYFATFIIGVFSSLLAQNASDNHHLDVHAMDALRGEKAKWWAEVQHRMRDVDNPTLKMEMVQYVLSRSFVWKEDDPRDSETRTAVLMLAAEVREAIAPALGSVPDDRQILKSENYRNTLLAALNPSQKPTMGTTETPTMETEPTTAALPAMQPSAQKKAPEAKPTSLPNEEPTSSTLWSIIVVLIVAAIGLLMLLLKRRS